MIVAFLGSVGHTTTLHTFKLDSHPCFLDLSNSTFLRIFKVSFMTKFHQMS